MGRYVVTVEPEKGPIRTLRARGKTVEEAALHVARRLAGKRAWAVRNTGDSGRSGYFVAFVPVGPKEWTTRGPAYHVTELG